ncbi:MAG: fibronectin type III domain-containing protein, partial [Dehalococcoidia bacterium]
HRSSLRSVLYFATGFAIVSLAAGFSIVRVLAVTSGETPSNVAVDQITLNTMRLSWRDNSSGETVFRIERSTNGTNYSEVGTLSSATSNTTGAAYTYTNSGMSSLSANAKYWYRVRACNANPIAYQSGKVYLAAVASGQCTGYGAASPKYTLANAPTSCSGTVDKSDSTRINWTWVSGGAQSGYYASDAAGNTGWVTRTYWNQTGLVCGTSYTLNVKARNGDLVQTSSVSCTATTKACAQTCGNNLQTVTERDYDQFNCVNPPADNREWSVPNGDSTSSCWQNKCCGDDSNEYPLIETFCDNVDYCVAVGASNKYCCNISNPSCITNDGVCHQAGVFTFGSGNDKYAVCSNFGDLGGLYPQGLGIYDCDLAPVVEPCLTSVCQGNYKDAENHWASPVAGEAKVGEYPDVNNTPACCGDDTNEYYVSSYCSGSGAGKCCNASSDKIDTSGSCVASCPNAGAPAFSLSNNSPVTVTIGGSAKDVTVTVKSLEGFNKSVSLSHNCNVSKLSCYWPAGSSCTPASNGSCAKPLRIKASTATAGTKTVTVSGSSSGYTNKTTNVSVTVSNSAKTQGTRK